MRGSVVDNAEAAQNRTAPEQRSWCCINDYEDHADTVTRSSRAICVDSPDSRLWRIADGTVEHRGLSGRVAGQLAADLVLRDRRGSGPGLQPDAILRLVTAHIDANWNGGAGEC